MSIDWLVNHDCRPKQELSPLGIYRRRQLRERFERVAEVAKAACPPGSISAIELDFLEVNAQGSRTIRTLGSGDMAAMVRQLDHLQGDCTACSANVLGGPFGCYGRVRFPISGAGERWLIDSLPETLSTPAGEMLPQVLVRLGCDGSEFRWLRERAGRYLELDEAPARSWAGPQGPFTTTTDGLYEAMFLTGGRDGVQAFHGILLCYLVGAFDDSSLPRFLSSHGDILPRGFRFDPKSARERSTRDLQFFFLALYRAACLGDSVSVRAPRAG